MSVFPSEAKKPLNRLIEGRTLTYNGLLFKLLFVWRVVSLALTPHLPISILLRRDIVTILLSDY